MATMVSRQPSANDLSSYYNTPPSPKSSVFKSHSRRPSFPSWLSRGPGQAPPSPATKVFQISDPQPTNAYDAAAKAPGALGKGATVVRTPQQAVNVGFPQNETPDETDEHTQDSIPIVDIKPLEPKPDEPIQERAVSPIPPTMPLVPRRDSLVPRRESPVPRRVESPAPLADYPASSRASPVLSGVRSLHTSKSYSYLQSPPRKTTTLPARNAPLPLNLVTSSRQPLLRSSLKPPSPTKPTAGPFLPLLPPPASLSNSKESPSSPLPPFHPVLLSGVPTAPIPPSQVIVTLETSTVSQRTTVATLTSRPSRLGSYLQALVPTANREQTADSNFSSLFAAHLAQAGLAPQMHPAHSGPIHIFLDRPSAPYAHILTYLRTTPASAGTLPRAASLALDTDPTRVEALCELRDEARYLELSELAELCDKELRARAPKLRTTASSSSLRDFKFGSTSGSEGRGSGEVEARLRDYRFGEPLKEEAEGEADGEASAEEVPPVVYEKKGSHAGIVVTIPPRGAQFTGSKLGHGRTSSARAPSSLGGRVRTISDAQYTRVHEQKKTWI
ncbi:hypothetical protein RhiJN_01219 [Ceratobasidium sp. AG-Ba]|nr:hypothetical protein RhiJN_01219 [Ceratobasidium sp. AG-Ba]